jgi:3D (Asp-Asp-Asp) domain-containing protein
MLQRPSLLAYAALAPLILVTMLVATLVVTLAGCATSQSSANASTSSTTNSTSRMIAAPPEELFAFNLPEPPQPMPDASKRTLWATYYHVWYAEVTSGTGHALLDTQGNALTGQLGARDWCMAGVEGTVLVRDTGGTLTTYNYAGRGQDVQVECAPYFNKGTLINPAAIGKTRWTIASGPYGDGVKGLILVPYRTIAVDTLSFPIGSVVYIPAACGKSVLLPSGQSVTHDGYFFASDIGGAIKDNHIDVFSGTSSKNPFTNFVMNTSSGTFPAYVIADSAIRQQLRHIHTLKPQK